MRGFMIGACVAIVATLAYSAHAQWGSQGGFTVPQEGGGGWSGTATSDLDMNGNDILLDSTNKVIFDGDGDSDTYCAETSEDIWRMYVGGINMMTASVDQVSVNKVDAAAKVVVFRNDTTTLDADVVGDVEFTAYDDAAAGEDYASLQATVVDNDAAGPDGKLCMLADHNDTLTEYLCVQGGATAGAYIPDGEKFCLDTACTHYISETSANNISLYSTGTLKGSFLQNSTALYARLGLTVSPASGNVENDVVVNWTKNDSTVVDGDNIAVFYHTSKDDIGGAENYAAVVSSVVDNDNIGPDGKLCMQADHNGTLTDYLCVEGGASEGVSIPATKKLYFDADKDTYFSASADDTLDFYAGGGLKVQMGSNGIGLQDLGRTVYGTGVDYYIRYDSSGTELELFSTNVDGSGTDGVVLAIDDGDTDIAHLVEPKGATTTTGGAFEDLTFAADPGDATKTTSGLVPDGAVLLGISTRVTTAGTNCTDYQVGDGSDADLYGAAGAVAQGTTTDNSDATANWSNPQLAAGEVTITAVGGNCFDMVVRVVAHYTTIGAPTSN